MKKLAVAAILVLMLAAVCAAPLGLKPAAPAPVYAGELSLPPYARITQKNTYLYANADNTRPLFALAYTYYVKIVGIEGEFYRVELLEDSGLFTRLNGYVYISAVTSVLTEPVAPLYPMQTVTVAASNARVLLTPGTQNVLCSVMNSQKMGYFGNIYVGGVEYYFVSYGTYLGYVESLLVTSPNITSHPTPIQTPDPIIPEPEPEPEPLPDPPIKDKPGIFENFDSGQLILILLITVPSLVIVLVLFAPSLTKKKREGNTLRERSVATASNKQNGQNGDKNLPRYYDDFL